MFTEADRHKDSKHTVRESWSENERKNDANFTMGKHKKYRQMCATYTFQHYSVRCATALDACISIGMHLQTKRKKWKNFVSRIFDERVTNRGTDSTASIP